MSRWVHIPADRTYNRVHGGRVVRASERDHELLGVDNLEEMYQDAVAGRNGLSIRDVNDYSSVVVVDYGPWSRLIRAAQHGSRYKA